MPRETPTGAELDEVLLGNVPGSTLICTEDHARRVIAGRFKTTHKGAEKWLADRVADHTLDWYRLVVSGSHHTVYEASGQIVGSGLYVHPGGIVGHGATGRYESVRLTADRDEVRRAAVQNHDRVYWVHASKFNEVRAARDALVQAKRDAEAAVLAENADVAGPLRELMRLAGVSRAKVSLVPHETDVFVMVTLEGSEARAVNAVLTGLLAKEPTDAGAGS